MNTFFKKIDDNNKVIQLFSYNNYFPLFYNSKINQITEEEYNQYMLEFQERAFLTNKVYKNEIKISDIPTRWQEEVKESVDIIISKIGLFEDLEINADEFQTMLEEVL